MPVDMTEAALRWEADVGAVPEGAYEVEFPEKLYCLFEPAPYKILYGGRGGAKSWGAARALLIIGSERPLRVLCSREIQHSIADSVHQLLADQIKELHLQEYYRVQEHGITGIDPETGRENGTTFFYAGLKHNINSIKSVEGCDVVWVEEAQTVSKESWDILIPTIRKPDSEIWITFNPDYEADDTYTRFVLNPPPGAVVVEISYRDNPWFPEKLEIERIHKLETDPVGYENIWGGKPKSSIQGAIFEKEIALAEKEKRIGLFPRSRRIPVDTFWDLGHGDKTAIWFVQDIDGWFRFIDYLEDSGQSIDHYLVELQTKGYLYGTHWVPHDAVDTIIHRKLGGGDKRESIEMIMRGAGLKVRIGPKLFVLDRIDAGRRKFPECQFDLEHCTEGLHRLRTYQWGPPDKNGAVPRTPLHNQASHGADAYQVFAVCAKHGHKPEPKKPLPPARQEYGPRSWMT